jgi:glyoxylate/hydroxypyruvate reductase
LAAPQSDRIAREPATALLVVDLDKHIGNARAWRDAFGEQLPDLGIRIGPDAGNLADIEYLAFMHPDFDSLPVYRRRS